MNRLIFIFALLLVACDTNIYDCQRPSVATSPAAPIQWWDINCDTYNEQEVCGLYQKCFCLPWNCTDEIKDQFTDVQTNDDYQFVIVDEDDNEIDRLDYSKETLEYDQNLGPLNKFINRRSGTDWTIEDEPFVRIEGPIIGAYNSKDLSPPSQTVLEAGALYRIDFNYDIDDQTATIRFLVLDEDDNVIYSDSEGVAGGPKNDNYSHEFQAPEGAVNIAISISRFVGSPSPILDFRVKSYSFVRIVNVHSASFIPNDLDICGQKVIFKRVNATTSPEEEIKKSDCHDIQEDHPCTKLITYSNNRNLYGLVYTDVSPEVEFNIRIPATMRVQRFPEEDTAIELSTGIEKTSGFMKAQMLFETDYMPYYMHQKLKLIFKHQSVAIDGKYWTKEEEYEIIEGDKKWPVKMGQVFLTERDFVVRTYL
jgi:hypothetical protein